MLGHDVTPGFDFVSIGNPRSELAAALSYVVLPMIAGAILSWLAIRLWMLRSHRTPFNRPPSSISALLGVALYPFMFSFYLLWATTHRMDSFLEQITRFPFGFIFAFFVSAPVLAITAVVFGYYVSGKGKNSRALDYLVILIAILCMPIEYFFLAYLLSQ